MIESIFNFIKWLFSPLYVICISIGGIISIILGAISNPQGAVNGFVCRIIDLILIPWPSTPEPLKLGSMLGYFANTVPVVGWGILLEIIKSCVAILLIVLVIKIYKLIPFKMT